jgi:RNA 2',3'-cyclic 3'-phosphodiesterase
MRLFIAVPLPDVARDLLCSVQDDLRGEVKRAAWVPRDAMHVTVRFLGETEEDLVPEIDEVLGDALAEYPSFEAVMKKGGAFPNAQRPKVFWVGLEDGVRFAALAHAANLALSALGLPAPYKPFFPHATLCRLRGPWLTGLPERLAGLGELGRFPVDRLVLYQSVLHPAGAQHSALRTYTLK